MHRELSPGHGLAGIRVNPDDEMAEPLGDADDQMAAELEFYREEQLAQHEADVQGKPEE